MIQGQKHPQRSVNLHQQGVSVYRHRSPISRRKRNSKIQKPCSSDFSEKTGSEGKDYQPRHSKLNGKKSNKIS